jgi:hypothetical protein
LSGYTIPTSEPSALVAGDTWEWTRDLGDYPNTLYTLRYYLHGASNLTITATAGATTTAHAVTVAAATTAAVTAGTVQWIARVTETATGKVYTIDQGTFNVLPDLAALAAAETHNEKMYAAIKATLEGRAVADVESYSINGRALNRTPFGELRRALADYARAVWAERHPGVPYPSQRIAFPAVGSAAGDRVTGGVDVSAFLRG